MANSYFHKLDDIAVKEIAPGFLSRFIHTEGNTFNFIEVKAGSDSPIHSHMHEQTAFVLKGEFEMTVDGETQVLTPGTYCIIPGNVPHGGRAVTDCTLLDIFNPIREDFRAM